MNIRVITKNIGLALLVEAGFMLLSAGVAAYYKFDASFSPLLLSGFLTLMVGLLPIIFVRKQQNRITTPEGLLILFLAWFLSCVFGLMPYALYGGEFSLENAWFESVSGLTATGATILQDIEALPRGLLFWRQATHFIGGLGVVVFMMIILPSAGTVKLRMRQLEVSDTSAGEYNFRSNKIVNVVLTIYVSAMVLCALLFMVAGMSLFEAVTNAFSVVATGGFSTRNASIGAFGSRWIELISMFFMLVSCMHYGLMYSSIAGRNLNLFRNPVVKFFFASIGIGIVLVFAGLMISGTYTNPLEALHQAAFNVVSLGSSTGMATVDTSVWPTFCMMILLYFSVQCGCSGSTTGGLKVDRIWLLFRAMRSQIVRTIHPNAVVRVNWNGQAAEAGMINSVTAYVVIYFMVMLACATFFSACGMDMVDSFTGSCACVSNVGPAFGTIGSLENYAQVPTLAKLMMGLEMIIGRLGFYAAFSIFAIRKH